MFHSESVAHTDVWQHTQHHNCLSRFRGRETAQPSTKIAIMKCRRVASRSVASRRRSAATEANLRMAVLATFRDRLENSTKLTLRMRSMSSSSSLKAQVVWAARHSALSTEHLSEQVCPRSTPELDQASARHFRSHWKSWHRLPGGNIATTVRIL